VGSRGTVLGKCQIGCIICTLIAILDGRTILRRCAGEQAISVEVVIKTIFWCLGIQTFV
jgi:hypothetical protein